jgi:drug/metabolite transporter, DME family
MLGVVLLAGLCHALFIFGFRDAAPHGSPQAILSIAFAVLALILFWPADVDQMGAAMGTPDWPLFATLGVAGAGLSFMLHVIGRPSSTTRPGAAFRSHVTRGIFRAS